MSKSADSQLQQELRPQEEIRFTSQSVFRRPSIEMISVYWTTEWDCSWNEFPTQVSGLHLGDGVKAATGSRE